MPVNVRALRMRFAGDGLSNFVTVIAIDGVTAIFCFVNLCIHATALRAVIRRVRVFFAWVHGLPIGIFRSRVGEVSVNRACRDVYDARLNVWRAWRGRGGVWTVRAGCLIDCVWHSHWLPLTLRGWERCVLLLHGGRRCISRLP